MPAPYSTVLFDLDHTLIDTEQAEQRAYVHAMASIGIDDPDPHFDHYVAINLALWRQVEAGTLVPDQVRHRRFEILIDELRQAGVAMADDADHLVMSDAFVWAFAHTAELFDGARDLLTEVRRRVDRTALVTNGLVEVQQVRVKQLDLGPFFDTIVISAAAGVSKPDPRIFDLVFDQLGSPDRSTAVMIGDSLTSDMQGAVNAGIATAWFAPDDRPTPTDPPIDHRLTALSEVVELI